MLEITTSRLTRGNFLFPRKLELHNDRVVVRQQRMFGADERSIPISKIASVSARAGMAFGGIRIESSESNAVIAGGGLANPEIGFSAPLRMDDPEMQAMRTNRLGQTLHALMVSIGQDSSMMGMGLPPGTLMNPIVNMRNVTDGNIRVKLVFRYQVGSSTQSFAIPPMQLVA